MPAYLQLFASDDATPITGTTAFGDVDAGTTGTLSTWHLWNDKGGTHADAITADGLTVRVKIGGAESGVPAQDQRWFGIQVVGFNNVGDSTMQVASSAVIRIGANAAAALPKIPKNCALFIQVSASPLAGVDNQSALPKLEFTVNESTIVLPLRLGVVSGGGVVSDWMSGSLRRLTRGRGLSASGTADVVVANGSWAAGGLPHTQAKEAITFNLTALDGALTSGNAYWARLSQPITGGSITVTKGNQAATPVKPAVPANEINCGAVKVSFQASAPVINTADLDTTDVLYGESFVTAGTGLNVIVWPGSMIASTDMGPFGESSVVVGVADNTTNFIWVLPTGSKTSTTTSTPPATGAQLLAKVVTSSGAVTTVTDARTFVGHALYDHVIELHKDGAFSATATDFAWECAPFDAVIVKVAMEIGQKGTSSSGSFVGDVTTRPKGADLGTAGTTIFTNFASDDQRPTIDHAASVLSTETVGHEVTTISKGDRIAGNIAAVPGTITVNPSDFVLYVYLRRLQ
jgi:hypothetical protein